MTGLTNGKRDAEVVQAARRPRRVLGRALGTAGDHDQVRASGQERGDGLVARGPQPAELRVAGDPKAGRAGGFGDQERRMRADGGRDQHPSRHMVSGSCQGWLSGGGRRCLRGPPR